MNASQCLYYVQNSIFRTSSLSLFLSLAARNLCLRAFISFWSHNKREKNRPNGEERYFSSFFLSFLSAICFQRYFPLNFYISLATHFFIIMHQFCNTDNNARSVTRPHLMPDDIIDIIMYLADKLALHLPICTSRNVGGDLKCIDRKREGAKLLALLLI